MEVTTSFKQFDFCKLCRINHKKRKKHIYSKKHQEILNNILKKYGIKISAAKKMLFTPEVRDVDFEQEAKFWCYFCAEEVEKHQRVELTTVLIGGLLEHIASTRHKENTVQFFWDNLLTDKNLRNSFLLTDGDLEIFKKASFLAVKKFQKAKALYRKQVAATISYVEFQRQNIIQSEAEQCQIATMDVGAMPGNSRHLEERISGKKTVSAYAEGLATVQIQVDDGEGNIYTGATPPWLQQDVQHDTGGCIGPTMADYQEHLKRVKKSKLPATRVGAKFDHSAESSQNWLPSFGRVWSKGRRLQSKLHFEKEWQTASKEARTAVVSSQKSAADKIEHVHTEHTQNSGNGVRYETETQFSRSNMADYHGTLPRNHWRTVQENSIQKAASPQNLIADSSNVNRHIMPYKRKRNIQDNTVYQSHWSETNQHVSNNSNNSANQIIPYKRNRAEAVVPNTLIQTPLLTGEKLKYTE